MAQDDGQWVALCDLAAYVVKANSRQMEELEDLIEFSL